MYDAIVVGAQCGGPPTAMLLARRGFKVLLVDKATFPSDTISTTHPVAPWRRDPRTLEAPSAPCRDRGAAHLPANDVRCGSICAADASYNRDPITAQGIGDAFIDAEAVVATLSAGLSDRSVFDEPLAAHETARNERVRPMCEFTTHLAALGPPPPDMQAPFGALRHNQDATNAFLSAITGAFPLLDFMSNENIGRIMAAANEAETSSARTI